MRIAEDVHLDGVVDASRCRSSSHGEKDSQIPAAVGARTYEQLVNSPKRELKIFTDREGGVQHSSFDNSINAGHVIADWVAETLGGRTARCPPFLGTQSMNIIGPDALVFGVDDVAACRQYLIDYGLVPVPRRHRRALRSARRHRHRNRASRRRAPRTALGTASMLRKPSTAWPTPPRWMRSPANCAATAKCAARRRVDRSGGRHGLCIGFQLTCAGRACRRAVNAPGAPAPAPNVVGADDAALTPRTLSHVVYFVPDAARRGVLRAPGFRCTDRFTGVGPFLQPAGTLDHHTLFMIQTPPFMKGCEHFTFHMGGPTRCCRPARGSSRRATSRSGGRDATASAPTGSGTSTAAGLPRRVRRRHGPARYDGPRARPRWAPMPRSCSCSSTARSGRRAAPPAGVKAD
jgi:hypothetical protein